MLILIGTVHRDPEGFSKLEHLLEKLQPEVVTIEISPVSLAWRRDKGAALKKKLKLIVHEIGVALGQDALELQKHPAVEAIFRMLDVPFEYLAALKYTRKTSAPLIMLDDPDAAGKRLALWETELLTRSNIENLLLEDQPSWQEQVGQTLRSASKILGNDADPEKNHEESYIESKNVAPSLEVGVEIEMISRELNLERESYMAEKIERLVEKHPQFKVCHIGGWEHLIVSREYPFLASSLEGYKPVRFLLDRNLSRIDSIPDE